MQCPAQERPLRRHTAKIQSCRNRAQLRGRAGNVSEHPSSKGRALRRRADGGTRDLSLSSSKSIEIDPCFGPQTVLCAQNTDCALVRAKVLSFEHVPSSPRVLKAGDEFCTGYQRRPAAMGRKLNVVEIFRKCRGLLGTFRRAQFPADASREGELTEVRAIH